MSWQRTVILVVGPFAMMGAAYWLTMPSGVEALADAISLAHAPAATSETASHDSKLLQSACRERAVEIGKGLTSGCRILVRPPFVLAGDMSEDALDRHYRETIVPTARALSTLYFDREPNHPIAIFMFGSEASYREHAAKLDGRDQPNYSGYYQRNESRVVLNISTGNGTLAHELTHALAHADFPEMPEWFDEGLASLIEQSEFSDDGLRLFGVSNWRLNYLLPALKRNQLQSTEALISAGRVRSGQEAVDYAHARYLCLYLQQRGLLCPYYRKFRTDVADDPTGLSTLCKLLGTDSLDSFDREFRQWVVTLGPAAPRPGSRDAGGVNSTGGSANH